MEALVIDIHAVDEAFSGPWIHVLNKIMFHQPIKLLERLCRFSLPAFKAPALSRLSPVAAYVAWTALARLEAGPVFRAVDQWGRHVGNDGLHVDSLVPLLRAVLALAGIASAALYSGNSLRRGLANWATVNGWDLKTLMEYVGWKNVQSAMRYVVSADPFAKRRIETAMPALYPVK